MNLQSAMPTALVITAAGINCDRELSQAFELAGAAPQSLHLHDLMDDPSLLEGFDLIGLPGGFSYGDAIAAGRIAAHLMRQTLYQAFVKAIERGTPIIAPCNGFQIAVQLGLLPGPEAGTPWPSDPPRPSAALITNESGRFIDRWCGVEVPDGTHCIWTRGIQADPAASVLPIAHGEGRFTPESPALVQTLRARGQVAIEYTSGDNPNGSVANIAGICDATGLVFGLMPHPERFTRWTQHPFWTRLEASTMRAAPIGLQMFRNAVAHVTRADAAQTTSKTTRPVGSAMASR